MECHNTSRQSTNPRHAAAGLAASPRCLHARHRWLPAADHCAAPGRWPRARHRQRLTLACIGAPTEDPGNDVLGGQLQTPPEHHPISTTNDTPKGWTLRPPASRESDSCSERSQPGLTASWPEGRSHPLTCQQQSRPSSNRRAHATHTRDTPPGALS